MAAIDLTAEVLPLAVCLRIQRADATVLGFTTHDLPLTVGGETYTSNAGIFPASIRQELLSGGGEGSPASLEITGILDDTAIGEADVLAGLYDGAQARLFLVDWSDTTKTAIKLLKGSIAAITVQDGQYTADVRSLAARLSQSVGELILPTCPVRALGDARCAVTLGPFQFSRTASVVTSRRAVTFAADAAATGYYDYGKVTFTTGANAGIAREVKAHTLSGGTAVITLQEAFPFDPQVGDTATLEAGCDRTWATCQAKFSNGNNFRGFPHLPGEDAVLA